MIRGRGRPRRPGDMNSLEKAYGEELERRRLAGELARWDFEPEKLRLADRTFYSPDFRVLLPDGTIEFHETKGFMRDDANVKLKVAAASHPYVFRLVRRLPRREGGGWEVTEV